jgi:hypothetical protein
VRLQSARVRAAKDARPERKFVVAILALVMALLSLLFPSRAAAASDIYFAQAAQGAANGADCADAYAYNDSTHGITKSQPTSFVAGNTLHLCGGTWSGGAGQQWISTNLSGSSSSPITIHFEAGAVLSAPYHSSSGAINIGGSFYVIDGGTNGVIQNSANGTSGYSGCPGGSCANQSTNTRAIYLTGNNIEVKNLSISDFYVIKPGSGDSTASSDGIEGIYFSGGHNNITVDHNVIHDMNHGIDGWGNTILEYNNEIYDCGRCVLMGPNHSSGFIFHDNIVHDLGVYNGTGVHEDGIHMFPSSNGQEADGVVLYNNYFYNPGTANTAFMYFEGQFGNGTADGSQPKIFNNLCILGASQADFCIEAGLDSGQNIAVNGALVANNTCIGGEYGPTSYSCFSIGSQSGAAGWTNVSYYNNVHVLGGQKTSPLQAGLITFGNGSNVSNINNNMYQDINTDAGDSNAFAHDGASTASFTTWKGMLPAGSGQDSAAIFSTLSNLKISLSTGQLQAGSPGIGAGANLTSLGIQALNCDKPLVVGASGTGACNQRPSSGNWDIGAYAQTSSNVTAPAAPSDLSASVQ